MRNDEMKPNRFARWAKARKLVAKIKATLEADGEVAVCTMTRATVFKKKHADMFKATRTGAYVQRGKNWDCIDFCGFQFFV